VFTKNVKTVATMNDHNTMPLTLGTSLRIKIWVTRAITVKRKRKTLLKFILCILLQKKLII